jgi:hypothetical protein
MFKMRRKMGAVTAIAHLAMETEAPWWDSRVSLPELRQAIGLVGLELGCCDKCRRKQKLADAHEEEFLKKVLEERYLTDAFEEKCLAEASEEKAPRWSREERNGRGRSKSC